MPDFLTKLVEDALNRIRAGYYDNVREMQHTPLSLKHAIKSADRNAIIAEIKPISPARGMLRPKVNAGKVAMQLASGGAVALSVLTEPDNFGGSLSNLQEVREHVKLPLLMKDIIFDSKQIVAGRKAGADSILLIESVFSRHRRDSLDDVIDTAHKHGLEVLLEVHNKDELKRALVTEADVVGINNRNLSTLETDLQTTGKILCGFTADGKVLISESGIETAEDIRRLKPTGVDGYLIGSSIMLAQDIETKIREFVTA